MYCNKCGKELADDARFCPSCGAPRAVGDVPDRSVPSEPEPVPAPAPTAAPTPDPEDAIGQAPSPVSPNAPVPSDEAGEPSAKGPKRTVLIGIAGVLAFAVIAGASYYCCKLIPAQDPPGAPSPAATAVATDEAAIVQKERESVVGAYKNVLANLNEDSFPTAWDKKGGPLYTYCLIVSNPNKPPLMAVRQDTGAGVDVVRFFSYDREAGEVLSPSDVVEVGVAPAGGFRGDLSVDGKTGEIYLVEVPGANADQRFERIYVQSDGVTRDVVATCKLGETPDGVPQLDDIHWFGVNETNPFNEYVNAGTLKPGCVTSAEKGVETAAAGNTAAGSAGNLDKRIAACEQEGKTILTGQVRTFTEQELVDYTGDNVPAAQLRSGVTHTVLILDEPRETALGPNSCQYTNASDRVVKMVEMRDWSHGSDLEGKHVTVAFAKGFWPTDTSLPLGQPYSNDYEVLG